MGWKMLVGVLLILIFLSSSLAGNLGGLKDRIFSILGNLGDNLKDVHLNDILPGNKDQKPLDLEISANILEIKPDSPVSLESSSLQVSDFSGTIKMDFENGKVIYKPDNSKLELKTNLEGEIKDLKFKKLVLQNLGLKILNEEWKDTTENGTIEIYDFYGSGLIKSNNFEIIGNISNVIRK